MSSWWREALHLSSAYGCFFVFFCGVTRYIFVPSRLFKADQDLCSCIAVAPLLCVLANSWHAFAWFFFKNGSLLSPSPTGQCFAGLVGWCAFNLLMTEHCWSCKVIFGLSAVVLEDFWFRTGGHFEGCLFLGNVWAAWFQTFGHSFFYMFFQNVSIWFTFTFTQEFP